MPHSCESCARASHPVTGLERGLGTTGLARCNMAQGITRRAHDVNVPSSSLPLLNVCPSSCSMLSEAHWWRRGVVPARAGRFRRRAHEAPTPARSLKKQVELEPTTAMAKNTFLLRLVLVLLVFCSGSRSSSFACSLQIGSFLAVASTRPACWC